MACVNRVLVVGGGVGGLTAGIALGNRGIAVDLVERQDAWSNQGVGIIQPNNVLRALDRIGLASSCVRDGAPFYSWRVHDSDGNLLSTIAAASDAAPTFPPINGIFRPALHRIMTAAATAAGVKIRLGVRTERLTDTGRDVVVATSDGLEETYDFVIGADGINSSIRRDLFGNKFEPRFLGEMIWRYNLRAPEGMDWGGIFFGPKSKAGLVPLAADAMYMFLVTPEPNERPPSRPDLAVQMRSRLAGHGGLIADLRDQIVDPDAVVCRPAQSLIVTDPWWKGRVIIIGDAAHAAPPHLAQGAAMAIEDGVLLATLLAERSSLQDGLSKFLSRRLNRTRMVVDVSTRTATWETLEWAGTPDPTADPAGALHLASLALMDDF